MKKLLLLMVIALLGAHSASAGSITFFMPGGPSNVAPVDNLIATGGALGDPLFGLGIDVSAIFGTGTPSNDGGAALCLDCQLDFTTGGLTFFDPVTDPNTWVFDGGGGLSVTGHMDLDGDFVVDPGEPNGLLLAGIFSSDSFVLNFSPGASVEGIAFSAIIDGMNPDLTSFYGISNALYDGQLVLNFDAERIDFDDPTDPDPAAFASSAVGIGFIINDIPEPATTLLLGLGLFGLVNQKRRRF